MKTNYIYHMSLSSYNVVAKIKTQILFSRKQPMWKTFVQADSQQMAKRRMPIPCRINKAIDTHLEYLILTAFHGSNGYTKGYQIYGIRKMPFLFI
jgi:hypothetical protein